MLKTIGLILALILCLVSAPGQAEQVGVPSTSLSAEDLDALVEQAKSQGVRIIVVEPDAADDRAEEDELSLTESVESVETSVAELIRTAKRDVGRLSDPIRAHWPRRGWAGLGAAIVIALLALFVGYLAERAAGHLLRGAPPPPGPKGLTASKYWLGLRAAFARLLGAAFQIAIAIVCFIAIFERGGPEREVGSAVILLGGFYLRLGLTIVDVFLPGRNAPFAVLDLSESATRRLRRDGQILAALLAILVGVLGIIDNLSLGVALLDLSEISLATAFILLFTITAWQNRRILTGALFDDPSSMLARIWPFLSVLYFASALVLFVLNKFLGIGISGISILSPVYCGTLALAVYAVLMVFTGRGSKIETVSAEHNVAPESEPDSEAEEKTERAADAREVGDGLLTGVGPAIAGTLALAFWIGSMAWSWGVPFLRADNGRVTGFWTVLLIILLARIGWIAIHAFFDRRIAEEGGAVAAGAPGDEGGGKGSRLGTLLPLFRSFLLITVAAIAVMIMLSQLGIDIAPLFAGAGLVGVAIGFGAQSLVRDIFSGLFFLIDDAFRVGEYIETGGLRGTVEKISIRSMQVRHHTGPLHTIPFGEITQLTNYSRDWVIMKLPLRVTFDTDPERVRKLIKKLGQELLEDPVIGDKFVEPLKSQGVREIDDSGQIIRVKFMTRPGEQFVLRKNVYARIRELFEREGIEFARREVRVRVSSPGQLTEDQIEEIAGAAAEGTLTPSPQDDPSAR